MTPYRTTILSLLLNLTILICFSQTTYYLDSTNGLDTNSGTSLASPWQSLSKISSQALSPGDQVLFKSGERFDGHFVVNGSGTLAQPILISSYGNGSKPVLTGEVGAVGGGDYQEAIYVNNNDNMTFDGLEINNERTVTRNGIDDKDAYGIQIHNSGNQIMKNFTFRNMTFQNVYAVLPILDPDDFNGLEVAGLRFFSTWNSVDNPKNIQDVLVEDCYFTDLQRLGIHIKHGGGNGNDDIVRNKNLVFRNNEFHFIGGTCILPSRTYNCLIENNIFNHPGDDSDSRMPNRGSSVWTWNCKNTVIQYNQCLHIRGYLDSHGIHIDHNNENTFVQYNYMEDCEGGFVEILGGNVNAVYRFNVSVNDGWRTNPNWANSNHTLWINEKIPNDQIHYSDYSYIYNNTVVMNTNFSTAIDIDAKNTHIYNNIFYATNGASLGSQQSVIHSNDTSLFMTNNLYFGNVNPTFISYDSNPQYGNPEFNNENSGDKSGYQINATSSAINTGTTHLGPPIPGAGTGVFTNIPSYPNVDFYGNPIDLSSNTPNIGACNSKDGTLSNQKPMHKFEFSIYPNPSESVIYLKNYAIGSTITFFNILGEKVLETTAHESINISSLKKGLYFLKSENFLPIKFVKK